MILSYSFSFFTLVPLIDNVIFISNVQHSDATVTYVIKRSPQWVQLLPVNTERYLHIIDYSSSAVLSSPGLIHIMIEILCPFIPFTYFIRLPWPLPHGNHRSLLRYDSKRRRKSCLLPKGPKKCLDFLKLERLLSVKTLSLKSHYVINTPALPSLLPQLSPDGQPG